MKVFILISLFVVSSLSFGLTEAVLEEKIKKGKLEINDKNAAEVFKFSDVIVRNRKLIFSKMSLKEKKDLIFHFLRQHNNGKDTRDPIFTSRLNLLLDEVGIEVPKKDIDDLVCQADQGNALSSIFKAVQSSTWNNGDCLELPPNQHRLINDSFRFGQSYLLSRKSNGDYKVSLVLDFNKKSGSFTKPQEMMLRVKECLKRSSHWMKGAKGEHLEIEVLSKEESVKIPASLRPVVQQIGIEDSKFRSHSLGYSDSIDCPGIYHEVLHLLGLCDEYQEGQSKYDCRVVPKAISVMKNHTEIFYLLKKAEAQSGTVVCPCDTTCEKVLGSASTNIKKLAMAQPIWAEERGRELLNNYCDVKDKKQIPVNLLGDIPSDEAIKTSVNKEKIDEKRSRIRMRLEATELKVNPDMSLSQEIIVMDCNCLDESCTEFKNFINNFKRVSDHLACPFQKAPLKFIPGQVSVPDKIQNGEYSSFRPYTKSMLDSFLSIFNQSKPVPKSLLHPNHFNKIIEGNCRKGKSKDYLACAEWAYKSTGEVACGAPQSCQKDEFYLGKSE